MFGFSHHSKRIIQWKSASEGVKDAKPASPRSVIRIQAFVIRESEFGHKGSQYKSKVESTVARLTWSLLPTSHGLSTTQTRYVPPSSATPSVRHCFSCGQRKPDQGQRNLMEIRCQTSKPNSSGANFVSFLMTPTFGFCFNFARAAGNKVKGSLPT